MGCGCAKKSYNPPLMGGTKGIVSDMRKSRQVPPNTFRALSIQREMNGAAIKAEQEKIKKIRQRTIREKFGHA